MEMVWKWDKNLWGGWEERPRNRIEYIRFDYDEYYQEEDYDKNDK